MVSLYIFLQITPWLTSLFVLVPSWLRWLGSSTSSTIPCYRKYMYVLKDLIVHTYNVTVMSLSCCSSKIKLCNLYIFLFWPSPVHEGLHLGTLCLCSRDGGCGDSLCVHSSGGCEGEPGAHQDSPCWAPLRRTTWGEYMLLVCSPCID